MRGLILLLLAASAWGQSSSGQTIIKGNPPGGIGGACVATNRIGYLNSAGQVITCPSGTLVWTVVGAGGGGAPLDSPHFTGVPTTPNAPQFTGNTQIANTQYVDAAVAVISPAAGTFANLIGGAPCSSALLDGTFFFTDSYYNFARCNGSSWDYFLNGVKMVPPDTAASFTSVNLGSATFDSSHGPGYIVNQSDATFSVKARVTAKPGASTWHVVLAFQPQLNNASNTLAGICSRESGTGKLDIFGFFQMSGGLVGFFMTDPTTYGGTTFVNNSGTAVFAPVANPPVIWLRFGQGTVNQTWDYSVDQGSTWVNVLTETKNTRFTADQVGYFVNGVQTKMLALHWAVTL